MVLQLLSKEAWIARLYRCDKPAKLHEELGGAPEMVAGAGTVRCGLLVLSYLQNYMSSGTLLSALAWRPVGAWFLHSRVRLAPPHVDSSAGAPCTPLPCRTTMSPRGALTKILTEMPLGS